MSQQAALTAPLWSAKAPRVVPPPRPLVQAALTQQVALIQGPPGTGKTYLGAKIIHCLLSNQASGEPILIVTYTNHGKQQLPPASATAFASPAAAVLVGASGIQSLHNGRVRGVSARLPARPPAAGPRRRQPDLRPLTLLALPSVPV